AEARRLPGLGRQPADGEEQPPLQRVPGRAELALAERAVAQGVAVGEHAGAVDRAVEGEGDDRVPGLVVGGRLVVRGLRLVHEAIVNAPAAPNGAAGKPPRSQERYIPPGCPPPPEDQPPPEDPPPDVPPVPPPVPPG